MLNHSIGMSALFGSSLTMGSGSYLTRLSEKTRKKQSLPCLTSSLMNFIHRRSFRTICQSGWNWQDRTSRPRTNHIVNRQPSKKVDSSQLFF